MKKLDKRNIEDILALTPMQEGMLFHYLKDPGRDYYSEQLSLEISGEIDIKCFEQAWNFVIQTNEILRAVFRYETVENPVQMVLKEHRLEPKYYDFSNKRIDETHELIEEIKIKDRKEKFDLRNIPFRVTLCKIEKNKYEMLISNHHILYDGWSSGIILREFLQSYFDLSDQKTPVSPVKNKFKEYLKWLEKQDAVKQEKYWGEYLKGFDIATKIPVKHINAKAKKAGVEDAEVHRFRFTGDIINKLENFVKRYKITLAALLYASWGLLLQKYNNTNDVIFGTTVSGRSAKIKSIEDIVGLFINTVPLRVQTWPDEAISNLLYRINKMLQIREEYESTPLVRIKECMHMSTALDTKEELFDSIMVIENYPLDSRLLKEKGRLSIDSYSMVEMTHYDLTIGIILFEEIEISFIYNEGGFDNESIINMSRHFREIIRAIVNHPDNKISDIEIITEEEKNKILYDFNNTGADYPGDKTIHQLFEEQAEETPDSVALVGSWHGVAPLANKGEKTGETVQLTYGELNRRSDQLAYLLEKKGVRPDTIVAMVVKSSIEMAVGILAILKTGGAYLPIDPAYPQDRIDYMIADSSVEILFTTRSFAKEIAFEKEIIYLEEYEKPTASPEKQPVTNYRNSLSQTEAGLENLRHVPCAMRHTSQASASLAYVIYTSGTIGRPKGVTVEHRNVVNTLLCRKENYKMKESDMALQLFSYSFDGFVTSFFTPIISGASVVLVSEENIKDTAKLAEIIANQHVTHFICIPPLFRFIFEHLTAEGAASLKVVTLAGDNVPTKLLEITADKNTGIEIVNEYGVTESSVMSTLNRHQERDPIVNIGKPAWNTAIYIMDQQNRLLPVGIPGELCISGRGVGRGYLNNPELTAEKFLNLTAKTREGTRNSSFIIHHSSFYSLYRTGDLGRWLPNGNIEFMGRIDHQVKIRGFRIESGEIESRLLEHPLIKEAVVIARDEGNEEKYLCAYFVSGKRLDPPELREFLVHTLPDYMIPSYFVQLDKIPLTSNGKVDKKAFPSPDHFIDETYEAPGDEIERKLVDIWSEVLGVAHTSIGIDNNFFELGGHSLKATVLSSKIHKKMNVKVPVATIFENSTIRGLARYVRRAKQDLYVSIPKAEKREYYPLSTAQRRLYITQHMKLEGLAYNVQNAVWLVGSLSREMLEEAFRKLIERHESFRTSFEMVNNQPMQRIYDEVEFKIEYYDLTAKTREDTRRKERNHHSSLIIHHFIHPFDLSQVPLLRVGLIETGEEKHILMMDMHHIIADFFSMNLFIKDFSAFCRKEELPPLNLQYKDFSLWQSITGREEQDEALNRQETYWLEMLEGEVPVLNLPFDYARPAIQQFDGAVVPFELDRETMALLKKMTLEEEVTLFMVLLAVFNVLLARVCDREDILVGTPVAGRRHADLQPVIGLFVNMLVLRNQPSTQKTFRNFLKEVKAKTLKAYENQDYPYDALVDKLSVERDGSRNPVFDVVFVWEGPEIELGYIPPIVTGAGTEGLKLKPYKLEKTSAVFDMILTGSESGENIHFSINYKTSLFKRKTIESIGRNFNEVLSEIVNDRNIKLVDIAISHGLMAAKSHALIEDRGDFGF